MASGPRRFDQLYGDGLDATPFRVAEAGLFDQAVDERIFVGEKRLTNLLAGWQSDKGGDINLGLAHGANLILPVASFETLSSRPAGDHS
jgi:hypothetical protein